MNKPPAISSEPRHKGLVASVILVSLAIHIIAALGAGIWIIAKWQKTPEATFEVKKMPEIPSKLIDPQFASAEFESVASRPVLNEKLASLREIDFALPDIPALDTSPPAFEPISETPSEIIGEELGKHLFSESGSEHSPHTSAIEFFGISEKASRVIILFDVSRSVVSKAEKSGISIRTIKQKTLTLLDQLSINTSFGLIQFVRNHKPFHQKLLPATSQNRQNATTWIEKEWNTSGSMPASGKGVIAEYPNGILRVLDTALQLSPDVIYLISDGNFYTSPSNRKVDLKDIDKKIRDHLKTSPEKMRLHFIGFEMDKTTKREIERIVNRTGGTLIEINSHSE